jgi:ABC-type bacteriocin/lantibiotic exporter with double-glycine peptidase domain
MLDIDQEKKGQPRHPDANWPATGAITAKNVKLRYRKDTELVLRGLNLNIKGGEKVGIVGRTGAGKSTLANAVTRMTEICDENDKDHEKGKPAGELCFDGVNICNINIQ